MSTIDRRVFMAGAAGLVLLPGCGGGEGLAEEATAPALPRAPRVSGPEAASDRPQALAWSNETEAVLNASHSPSWVYYTDRSNGRWYISPMSAFSQTSGIYSLGPLVNGEASWWTVAGRALTGTPGTNQLRAAANLDTDPSNTFYDIGRGVNVTDASIHQDRQLIQNSSVVTKWYFFEAPNGNWYIVNEPAYGSSNPPQVYRFSQRNGAYDWIAIDTAGTRTLFSWSGGQVKVAFSPAPGYATANVGLAHDMDGAYGAQCVDLMHHYIANALGIAYPHGFTGNAYAVYQAAAASTVKTSAKYGSVSFTKIANTPTGAPLPGDIVFWSAPSPGHVAIVLEADVNGFTSLDQNWVNASASNGSPAARVSHNYNNVAGWLHPSY